MGQPLAVSGVSKAFGGKKAVDDLSFSVEEGEIFGFLGENGAGKTTTIRMVLDIIRPDAGSISVLGGAPGAHNARDIGFLAEERGLYARMSALETIQFFGRLKGMAARDARREGMAILERFGLADRAASPIGEMSKGMAQKVQLATALVNAPRLLLLDEPFSGLDPVNQQLLEDEILAAARRGAAVVFSTHIMQNAERLCDRMLILRRGEKRFEGTIEEARATMPIEVEISVRGNPRMLDGVSDRLPGALFERTDVRDDAISDWRVALPSGTSVGDLLEACTSHGLVLRRFEERRRSMHDIFMWHVGQEQAR